MEQPTAVDAQEVINELLKQVQALTYEKTLLAVQVRHILKEQQQAIEHLREQAKKEGEVNGG